MNLSLHRLLCLIGLLGSAACTGTIDNNEDRSSLRPAPGNGAGSAAPGQQPAATPGTTPARGTDGASEGTTPVGGISGGSSSSSGARRGGARARDPQRVDAGEDDELDVDAGVVDADAGVVDAGGVDAGPGGDASAARL